MYVWYIDKCDFICIYMCMCACVYKGVLFRHKEEKLWNLLKMNETGAHNVQWNKPASTRHIVHFFSHMQNLDSK
jgi:hypothetical protein